MSIKKRIVLKSEFSKDDFIALLLTANGLLVVFLFEGFFGKKVNVLGRIFYVDTELEFFCFTEFYSNDNRQVRIADLRGFGVLCDVPEPEESDCVERN